MQIMAQIKSPQSAFSQPKNVEKKANPSSDLSLGNRAVSQVSATQYSDGIYGTGLQPANTGKNFYPSLVKAYGQEIAAHAVDAVQLPSDWKTSSAALDDRSVTLIITKAEAMLNEPKIDVANKEALSRFINGKGDDSLAGVFRLKMLELKDKKIAHQRQNEKADLTNKEKQILKSWLKNDADSPELRKFFKEHVEKRLLNGKLLLTPEVLKEFALQACMEFYSEKKKAFAEACPNLANFADSEYINKSFSSFDTAYTALLNEFYSAKPFPEGEIKSSDQLRCDSRNFHALAWHCLAEIRVTIDLQKTVSSSKVGVKLNKNEYVATRILSQVKELDFRKDLIKEATTEGGKLLGKCLLDELNYQESLLDKQKNIAGKK